jgi:hypothetical protein
MWRKSVTRIAGWKGVGAAVVLFVVSQPLALLGQSKEEPSEEVANIEDNSFFVEEAFNQEVRVVQHIFNGVYYQKPTENTMSTFTQEWPLVGQDHQFSYTLAYGFLSHPAQRGVGDTFLHYRYQAFDDATRGALAPRLSIVLPTGSKEKGLGYGVVGWQVNIPYSKMVSDQVIVHLNAGTTLFPHVSGMDAAGKDVHRTLPWFNVGGSAIWLATPTMNLMFETMFNKTSDIGEDGEIARSSELILSPGVRVAINLPGMQIVPGFAVPLSMSAEESHLGLFFYLSFEHPY